MNLVTDIDNVFGVVDALVGQLADVDEAVLAGKEFHERTEFLDGDDAAFVDFANLSLGGHAFDGLAGDLHAVLADRVDVHGAVVLDVDFAAGLFDEALDVLAAGSDERADLLGVDLHGHDARSILVELLAGLGDDREHRIKDGEPRNAGLLEGLGQNLVRQAAELEVELEAGDALGGAGELAVHVTEGVFPADDVGEHAVVADDVVLIGLAAEADADAGDRAGDGHAGVHERQCAGADGGHGGGTVGFHDLRSDADGVGELVEGNHRLERTLGERAVTDLAATRAHDAARLTDGEVREVVVQEELFLGLATGPGVEVLRVLGGAQGGEGHGLSLATDEHGGTVRAGEHADFAAQGAQVIATTTIQALARGHDHLAGGFLLDVVEGLGDGELGDLLRAVFLDELHADLVLDGFARGFAGELAGGEQRGGDAAAGEFLGVLEDFVGDEDERDVALLLADLRGEFLLRGDERLAGLVGEAQGVVQVRLGDLVGTAFDHHHVFFIADIHEVEIALGHLRVSGVGDELAADTTDAHRAERPGERDVADHQRRARAEDAEDIGVVLAIRAEEDGLDLDFVEPTLGEQRPDGPVREAHGENFLLGGAPFALEVAAGELAAGSGLLAVVHGEREELLPFLGLHGGDGGSEDDGFAELDDDGSVCLLCDFAGLYGKSLPSDLGGDFG